MYIQLYHRSYGVHTPIKHIEIPCDFHRVYISNDKIDEELLMSNIPDNWLPVPEDRILLTVGNGNGSTGQCNLSIFRPWAKYFDAYVLELLECPLTWWDHEQSI